MTRPLVLDGPEPLRFPGARKGSALPDPLLQKARVRSVSRVLLWKLWIT